MRTVYLSMAILGAVIPYVFFLQFGVREGGDLLGFVPALFVNGAAGGFTADLLITSFVFWIYLFSRKDGPTAWPFIALNLAIGLSCALPAYLYVVTKPASLARSA